MIIQNGWDDFREYCDWMEKQRLPMAIQDDLPSALDEVTRAPRAWNQLIIRMDRLGTHKDLVPQIIAFREKVPSVPVIVTTRTAPRNCFALENLYVCDVLLHEPSDMNSFEFALAVAPINNEVWKRRQSIETASRKVDPSRADNIVPLTRRPAAQTSAGGWRQEKPNSFA
ncbi:hypothetical protein NHN26_11790 [Rhodovulum tesquicola]|nr:MULTISPECIES: hypothetical protein [Rhodovulum]MCO8145907.1 hypothetical protein [Rhodovulum tesquicola]